MLDKKKYKESTIITHAGQESGEHFGFVNTPVYRGSTVLSKTSNQKEKINPKKAGKKFRQIFAPEGRINNSL